MKRLWAPILVAVLAAVLFTGLLFLDFQREDSLGGEESRVFYRTLDSRLYDLLLRIKPAIEEDPKILLLEADDQTITEVDTYPLPRDLFADGLILMAEFSPAWTMLDIEFVDGSENAIDYDWLDYGIGEQVDNSFADLAEFQRQLVELLLNGQLTRAQALEYLSDLEAAGWDAADQIRDGIGKITYSRDTYLGQAIAYLGKVSATINMTEDKDETISPELRTWAEENVSVNDYLTLEYDPFDSASEILPSIFPVIGSAAWAGFPRMHIDPDGVRRRVDVLYEQNGRYYTHMGFGTWWVRAGKPPITVRRGSMEVGDLVIPLDPRGKMLINWPKRQFDGTPLNRRQAENFDPTNPKHRLSFFYLYYHDLLMKDLSAFVAELERYGITSDLYGETEVALSVFENDLQTLQAAMLESGDGSRAPELGDYREQYLAEVGAFVGGSAESLVLDELRQVLNDPQLSDEDFSYYADLAEIIPYLFEETRIILDDIAAYRDYLRDRLEGATVVMGYTGTSTTDYGANPFERKYMNMGIYGAVYNSLLQGNFLTEVPLWISGLISLIAGILVALLTHMSQKNSVANTIVGAGFVIVAVLGAGTLFVFTGTYIHLLPLILTLVTAYLASIIMNFITTSKERAFIQNAFGQIISPDVVQEIQDNPDRLNISGDNRMITAMFSDIEKFSTISEYLGSSDKLFEFLKRYLTPMSDIILEERGTIDKYEGDAIIAFWNAPLDQNDHAHRACRAAMRMVRLEKQINEELIADGLLDKEMMKKLPHGGLFTRIGINTGINNVGFIGTEKRKDYTALGDEMNLASRLEGVNKLYGTQVLISGPTEEIIHTEFITRRLDRVRVMGKDKPVALYELSYSKEFPDDFSDTERECFNYYRDALDLFLQKKWDDAEDLFNRILKLLPNDGPTKVFVERCQKYRKTPPPGNWDGVYKMETK